jgi:hypothetical protein
MNKIEKNVSEIEQKFKRADELIDIKSEILSLKNTLKNLTLKNEQKRTKQN